MFAALREAALVCGRCPHLARSRTQVVFGVGNSNAELMFVGEAPGADEDAQGEPFVGRAGQLLTKIIEAMGFRREDVYIANVLKCRPDMPPGISGNRKPTPEEMKTCLPWLEKQIELIKPRVMVALGATALEGLLGATTAVNKLRGRWLDFHGFRHGHLSPPCLLRNQSVTEKRKGLGRHAASAGAAREANQRKATKVFHEDRVMKRSRIVVRPLSGRSAGIFGTTAIEPIRQVERASCRTHLARISVAIQQPTMRLLFGMNARIRVVYYHEIPTQGGFILASNHISHFDPPIITPLFAQNRLDRHVRSLPWTHSSRTLYGLECHPHCAMSRSRRLAYRREATPRRARGRDLSRGNSRWRWIDHQRRHQ